LNPFAEGGKPPYRGWIRTNDGKKTITAYCGRDRDFNDYLKCYVARWNDGKPKKFRATVSSKDRQGDYYANLNEEEVVQLVFKRVFNANGNIVDLINIFYDSPTD